MAYIDLPNGIKVLVDDEDYENLSQYSWSLTGKYVSRKYQVGSGHKNRKFVHVYMHRQVNNTPDGLYTDHINGNPLDNRKCNLRTATQTENLRNRKLGRKSREGKYKGVQKPKDSTKWTAFINIDGKGTYIGSFNSDINAATAYNLMAAMHHGEFARYN